MYRTVAAATWAKSTSAPSGMWRVWTASVWSRPSVLGGGTYSSMSKRPGRSSAASTAEGRFVAARTSTPAQAQLHHCGILYGHLPHASQPRRERRYVCHLTCTCSKSVWQSVHIRASSLFCTLGMTPQSHMKIAATACRCRPVASSRPSISVSSVERSRAAAPDCPPSPPSLLPAVASGGPFSEPHFVV